MAESNRYDVAIIGGGPAGYVGAIRASQLGLSACVIEKDKPGGVCLNMGCIPSKALIHEAESFMGLEHLESLGVKVDLSSFDYSKVYAKSRKAANTLSKGVNFLLKKNKVDLIVGTGRLSAPNRIMVDDDKSIEARQILVATGSRPVELKPFPFDGTYVLSSDGALMLKALPSSLIILGGGVIGCEFAHIMNAFGVKVTIVEMLDRILPMEDADASEVLRRAFKKRGVDMHTGTRAISMAKTDAGVALTVEKNGTQSALTAEKMLVVVGRRPNTENLGLEELGIFLDKGFIRVGDFHETNVKGVYAAGDVTASPLLAHVASKEAEIAVEAMAGLNPQPVVAPDEIPSAVYTDPQVASFGLTEAKAEETGIPYKTAAFPYRGAGKSVAIEKPEGIVKIVFDPETHEILGAQVAGTEATEIIHELLLAKTAELLPEDIANMIHAHPTISESVMEAARAAEGWAIHA